MRGARAAAIGFCVAAVVSSVTLGVATALCGAQVTRPVAPGEPAGPSECVSAFHPATVVFGLASLVALGAVMLGHPWVATALGALVALFGLALAFSLGAYGLSIGVMVALGGLFGALSQRLRRAVAA